MREMTPPEETTELGHSVATMVDLSRRRKSLAALHGRWAAVPSHRTAIEPEEASIFAEVAGYAERS